MVRCCCSSRSSEKGISSSFLSSRRGAVLTFKLYYTYYYSYICRMFSWPSLAAWKSVSCGLRMPTAPNTYTRPSPSLYKSPLTAALSACTRSRYHPFPNHLCSSRRTDFATLFLPTMMMMLLLLLRSLPIPFARSALDRCGPTIFTDRRHHQASVTPCRAWPSRVLLSLSILFRGALPCTCMMELCP